jgi:hypothetical protein
VEIKEVSIIIVEEITAAKFRSYAPIPSVIGTIFMTNSCESIYKNMQIDQG